MDIATLNHPNLLTFFTLVFNSWKGTIQKRFFSKFYHIFHKHPITFWVYCITLVEIFNNRSIIWTLIFQKELRIF